MKHIIRWFGVAGDKRIPRTKTMPLAAWGWDARCSCGWQTRTGGAIAERIKDEIAAHRREQEGIAEIESSVANLFLGRAAPAPKVQPTKCLGCGKRSLAIFCKKSYETCRALYLRQRRQEAQ